jgi:hypothetical protein
MFPGKRSPSNLTALLFRSALIWSALVLPTSTRANDAPVLTVHPISLQIVSPRSAADRPSSWTLERRMQLGILIESETMPIAAIEAWQTRLIALTDDTGATLSYPGIGATSAQVSSNHLAGWITFDLTNAPAPGAKTISASGKLAVVFGRKKESVVLTNITLEPQPLSWPGQKFSILRVSEQMGALDGNYRSPSSLVPVKNVCLRAEGEAAAWIEAVEFLDATGQVLKSVRGGEKSSLSTAQPAASFTEREFLVPRDTPTVTLKITLWTERESRLVPFSFSTGMGL